VDAELLLAHTLGLPRSRVLLVDHPEPAALEQFQAAVARRATREPLQHIVGTAAFRHVVVPVGPGVFVPRPETELLVDAVLPTLHASPHPTVVDLCSGSGALALALADEVPAARVFGVERAGRSGDWLVRNTEGTRVEAVLADVTDATVVTELRAVVDAVVCNPPYVPDTRAVAAEVRFDPDLAVFAGPDGLALMPHVLARAADFLRPGGVLALEHDETHADCVPALLEADGRFTGVTGHLDLTGRPRYATARRR